MPQAPENRSRVLQALHAATGCGLFVDRNQLDRKQVRKQLFEDRQIHLLPRPLLVGSLQRLVLGSLVRRNLLPDRLFSGKPIPEPGAEQQVGQSAGALARVSPA